MPLETALLALKLWATALSLGNPWYPPGQEPETAEQRHARLGVIASAIATEAEAAQDWRWGTEELAAAAFTKLWFESRRMSLEVHSGRVTGDNGKARCLAQVHDNPWSTRAEWRASTGTDLESTRLCARLAIRALVVSDNRCNGHAQELDRRRVGRAFAAYGTGRSCSSKLRFARERSAMWAGLMARLGG